MMEARITVSGNVGAPVEHFRAQQPGSASRSVFRLACTPRFQRQGSWIDDQTIWLRVTCWRGLAENVAESVNKGDPVTVVGRLRNNVWDDDDGHHQRLELDADTVGPDLTRGASVFRRTSRAEESDDNDERAPQEAAGQEDAEAELAAV